MNITMEYRRSSNSKKLQKMDNKFLPLDSTVQEEDNVEHQVLGEGIVSSNQAVSEEGF